MRFAGIGYAVIISNRIINLSRSYTPPSPKCIYINNPANAAAVRECIEIIKTYNASIQYII
jgi:hypothetical protein